MLVEPFSFMNKFLPARERERGSSVVFVGFPARKISICSQNSVDTEAKGLAKFFARGQ